jgi:glycosyltransferase involved in cell wall biosynthesis
MATCNGEKYIKEQLDSILCQLGKDDEVVVSDDESSDATVGILKQYSDDRIKIYHHQKQPQKFKFGYATRNFENALNHALGDVIFLADQDDVWLPNKVQAMTVALEKSDLVLSDCTVVDDKLAVMYPSCFGSMKVQTGIAKNIFRPKYLGSCMAFHKKVLPLFLPFPQNVPHDLWIGLTVSSKGRILLLNRPTMLYRRHDATVTPAGPKRNTHSLFFKLSYRYYVIRAFFKWKFLRFNMFNIAKSVCNERITKADSARLHEKHLQSS